MPKDERRTRPNATDEAPGTDSASGSGRPTTAGAAPGGRDTGMHTDVSVTGAVPTQDVMATGRTGESAGGLASGPAGAGGSRNRAASGASRGAAAGDLTDQLTEPDLDSEPSTLDVDAPTPGAGIMDPNPLPKGGGKT